MPQISTSEAVALLDKIIQDAQRVRALIQPKAADIGDPKDPRNKTVDGKLTPRGVEVLYRMFDQGLTRYAAADALSVSYAACSHRFGTYQKAGGKSRKRVSID